MKLGVTHDVLVVKTAGESGWRGHCMDCRWTGPHRPDKWSATGDIEAHLALRAKEPR